LRHSIYSDPKHIILYTSNGEVRQEFFIVFTALAVTGEPTPSTRAARFDGFVARTYRTTGWIVR
jgi:hypothetical protein